MGLAARPTGTKGRPVAPLCFIRSCASMSAEAGFHTENAPMRIIIDSLIALMLVALLAMVLFHHRQQSNQLAHQRQAQQALAQLHEQVVYRSALERPKPDEVADVRFPQ